MNKLIESLLAVSRIEKGTLQLEYQDVQLEDSVERIIKELSNLAEGKHLTLVFEKPPELLPKVRIDLTRIEEVITNLIGNAIKYTDTGAVTVSMKLDNDSVVTAVSDTGEGIPKQSLDNLFTKFFRVKGDLRARPKGTGLGLYISKNIIQSHGGTIWVESEVGKGSTFSFTVPVAKGAMPEKSVNGGQFVVSGS